MATNPYLLLCNGADAGATRPKEWATVEPQSLRTFGRSNVTLRIADLTDRMGEQLPNTVQDLIELAAMIYAADQSCARTGGKTFDWGERWHRTFRFEVMVREPDFWNSAAVKAALMETLGFLSEDNYDFAFRKMLKPPAFAGYLEFNKGAGLPDPVDRVILFSGGLDSLTGAVEDVLGQRRRVAMVSHKPVDHLAVKQRAVVKEIGRLAGDPKLRPLHFPVKANKDGALTNDHTQRSRSFLYAAMAAAVAHYFRLNEIHFYENGIVSVNLPICQQEIGAKATRTTHPQTLAGFGRLFALVTGRRGFAVHNELFWQTKQDALEMLKRSGHSVLARQSLSCTHTRGYTLPSPHCGLCSQCMSRRIAALGAEYGEDDPASGYRADVLLGPRPKDEDRVLAERFVGFARAVEEMSDVDEFHRTFAGELGRVTPHLSSAEMTTRAVVEKLFELHKRHATQVGAVMTSQMAAFAEARRRVRLEPTCMLNLGFDVGQPGRAVTSPVIEPSDTSDRRVKPKRLDIGEPGMPCRVNGHEKPALSQPARKVLSVLIKAGPDGLSKDELERASPSARRILRTLRKDSEWREVILMPNRAHGRYRVRG